MKTALIFIAILAMGPSAHAAIPSKSNRTEKSKVSQRIANSKKKQNYDEVVMALRLPMENRLMALSRRSGSFEDLKKMSFDPSQTLQLRWRALTAMARLDFQRSRPMLIQALTSKEWFMRNAALVTLPPGDKAMALDWSVKLLRDPALVVRTAAVENLRQLRDRRAREPLMSAFRANENFKGKQSLWVRHYIARALSEMAIPGEESFLVKLLHEDDNRIHPWAIMGLERLTGKTLGASRSTPENRNLWIAWSRGES